MWLYGSGGRGGSNISVIPSASLIWARLATYTYLILTGGPTSALADLDVLSALTLSSNGPDGEKRVVVAAAYIPFLNVAVFRLLYLGMNVFFFVRVFLWQ